MTLKRQETGFAWDPVHPPQRLAPPSVKAEKAKNVGHWLRAVILPDPQIGYRRLDNDTLDPFHDKLALKVAWKVTQQVDPEVVVWLGDFLDLPSFGRYRQEPGFAQTTQAGVDEGYYWLSQFAPLANETRLIEGNHDCLGSAKAITKAGLTPQEDLQPGDEVLSADDDGNAIWQTVEAVHRYDYDGEMVRVGGLLTTPNHRLVGLTKRKRQWTEQLAGDVKATSPFLMYRAAHNPTADAYIKDNDIRRAAWCWTDSHRTSQYGYWFFYQRAEKAERMLRLFPEGKVRSRFRDPVTFPNGITCATPAEAVEIRVGASPDLDALVPDRTRLAPWVWTLSERQVRVLLDEWIYTDGSESSGNGSSAVIYCCKDDLRRDLMLLLMRNGVQVSETEYRPGQWRINVCHRPWRQTDAPTREHYQGTVWCVSVPNGRFFVEEQGKFFLTGNSRIQNYITDNALAAAGLRPARGPAPDWPVLSVPYLLRLDELGIAYVGGYPSGATYLNDNLACIHGHKVKSNGSTAAEMANSEAVSTIFGHVHRRETHWSTRNGRGRSYQIMGHSPGTLSRIDGGVPSVHSALDLRTGRPVKHWENWQQGLTVVHYEPDGDQRFWIEPVAIDQGVAFYRDKVYTA